MIFIYEYSVFWQLANPVQFQVTIFYIFICFRQAKSYIVIRKIHYNFFMFLVIALNKINI